MRGILLSSKCCSLSTPSWKELHRKWNSKVNCILSDLLMLFSEWNVCSKRCLIYMYYQVSWKTCTKHFFTLSLWPSCIHVKTFYADRGSNFFLHQATSLTHCDDSPIPTSVSQAAPLGYTEIVFNSSKVASHICGKVKDMEGHKKFQRKK